MERRLLLRPVPTGTPQEPDALLELRCFGVAYGKKVVLSEISLSIPETGVTVLLGPTGTRKSTLLRTLAGLSSASPSFRSWGEAFYRGAVLDGAERPELVAQSAKLMMSSVLENVVINLPERHQLTRPMQRELAQRLLLRAGLHELVDKLDQPAVNLTLAQQRHLAILRQLAAGPRLLCIDEPTSGLNDAESENLLGYLRAEANRRALLVILHNQQHARLLGGKAVLIAGGHVQEQQAIPAIFDATVSAAAREFARSGSCSVASPGTPAECLDETAAPPKPLPKAAFNYSGNAAGSRRATVSGSPTRREVSVACGSGRSTAARASRGSSRCAASTTSSALRGTPTARASPGALRQGRPSRSGTSPAPRMPTPPSCAVRTYRRPSTPSSRRAVTGWASCTRAR